MAKEFIDAAALDENCAVMGYSLTDSPKTVRKSTIAQLRTLLADTSLMKDAYIVSGSTAFSSGWLSETDGGTALTPSEGTLYLIKTAGTYYLAKYGWTGSVYEPYEAHIGITQSITDGDTEHAPSGDAVYDKFGTIESSISQYGLSVDSDGYICQTI